MGDGADGKGEVENIVTPPPEAEIEGEEERRKAGSGCPFSG